VSVCGCSHCFACVACERSVQTHVGASHSLQHSCMCANSCCSLLACMHLHARRVTDAPDHWGVGPVVLMQFKRAHVRCILSARPAGAVDWCVPAGRQLECSQRHSGIPSGYLLLGSRAFWCSESCCVGALAALVCICVGSPLFAVIRVHIFFCELHESCAGSLLCLLNSWLYLH
jgi:hypothetical protein